MLYSIAFHSKYCSLTVQVLYSMTCWVYCLTGRFLWNLNQFTEQKVLLPLILKYILLTVLTYSGYGKYLDLVKYLYICNTHFLNILQNYTSIRLTCVWVQLIWCSFLFWPVGCVCIPKYEDWCVFLSKHGKPTKWKEKKERRYKRQTSF